MAKKITPIQRLVEFAMGVTEDELSGAIETLKAIKDNRFPSKPARKARADKGSRRTPAPSTPAAPAASEPTDQ